MTLKYHGINYRWSVSKFLLNFILIILFSSITLVFIINVAGGITVKRVATLTVQRGDTLWSIARAIAPGKDPRMIIYNIKSRNNLTDSNLVVGQKLFLEM